MRQRVFHGALILLLSAVLCACAATAKKESKKPQAPLYTGRYPRVVAILPFANDTDEIGLGNRVRKSFYNHFSSKPYKDIELSRVDAKVSLLEKRAGKTLSDIPPEEIGGATGADGVIYGRVTDFTKVYALAYSQVGTGAEVWMVDAKTGKEVWRVKEEARFHEGGVPLSPIGAVMTMVTTAMNIREMQTIRVINEIGWKLNEKVPSPPELKTEERPVIKNVISNAKESPFGKGKTLRVAMEGEKGLVALFEVAGFKKAMPMKEVSPGEYLGEYLVLPGDNVRDAPLVAYLRHPGAEGGEGGVRGERGGEAESEWLDISGFVTMDTTPPPAPAGLRARGLPDRAELNWKGVLAPDLRGYKVMRSAKPLSDYEEAGFTEEAAFTDRTLKPREIYYFRVASVDAANNTGDPTEPVKLTLRDSEIRELPSSIDKDMTLFAGTYLVKGETVVEPGAALTVMPDTKMLFDGKSSLVVKGTLVSEGEKELLIEYLPRGGIGAGGAVREGDTIYRGIRIEGGAGGSASIRYSRISGADTALSVKNSASIVSNSIIEHNSVGLLFEGLPSPVLLETTVWHNTTGLSLLNSKAEIRRNGISQNATGLFSSDSSPQVTENNIHDNAMNMEARTSPFPVDNNYFGSINVDEMRLKGGFRVKWALDAPFPGGRPTGTVQNPYAALTPDERKTKAAEMLQSAGRYFRERNFGKAAGLFEESLKADEGSTAYYYLGLAYQGMDDNEKALSYLKKGTEKFPMDSNLLKSYGLLLYQLDREEPAREVLREALRLNPGDKQIRFVLERLESR